MKMKVSEEKINGTIIDYKTEVLIQVRTVQKHNDGVDQIRQRFSIKDEAHSQHNAGTEASQKRCFPSIAAPHRAREVLVVPLLVGTRWRLFGGSGDLGAGKSHSR